MEKDLVTGKNIFIDFSVIQKSDTTLLKEEFETILSYQNKIIVWSKNVSRLVMKAYCQSIEIDMSEENDIRNRIKELRNEKLTYKNISDKIGIPIANVGYYLRTSNSKKWTLDDWVKEYVKKDSFVYQMVDFIIDPDERFVNKFKRRGIGGNVLEEIK